MDSSPLIKAHDHAKAASDATQTANSTVAINEHTLAAGEFSNAAKATSSIEALRTLRLLEQHHQKLSELIKFSVDHPAKRSVSEKDAAAAAEDGADSTVAQINLADANTDPASETSSKPATAAIPGLTPQRRYPPSRELSSSIASNLASARGIRSSRHRAQPAAPSISNDQAPGNVDVSARKDGSRTRMQHMLDAKNAKQKPSWVPPAQPPLTTTATRGGERQPFSASSSILEERADGEPMTTSTVTEEGFSRFYSTFGSIINRLSAPLAFAGLPLITEESSSEATSSSNVPTTAALDSPHHARGGKKAQHVSHQHRDVATSDEPDLSKIFSKAALQAVYRDGHSGNDSFFVVPTSGHTVSYANILNFDQKEKRRAMAASVHSEQDPNHHDTTALEDQEDEEFVDARASNYQQQQQQQQHTVLSPSTKRRLGKSQTEKELYNVIEELNMENQSLKGTLDKVTKRLHAFEASAQHSRLAMVDSMRLVAPQAPVSPSSLLSQSGGGGSGSGPDEALKKRTRELEEELALASKQFEVLERDNKHLKRTIEKYREKWEALKAGAKARREASQSADN